MWPGPLNAFEINPELSCDSSSQRCRPRPDLRGPVLRVTGYDVPYPFWQIEDAYMPSVARVVDAARRLLTEF